MLFILLFTDSHFVNWFILQASLVCLLFGETLSMGWWFGTSLIFTSLILVHYNVQDHLVVKKD